MKKHNDLEKIKQKSKFVQDVMNPIEKVFGAIEKGIEDYYNPDSDFNLTNRGIKKWN